MWNMNKALQEAIRLFDSQAKLAAEISRRTGKPVRQQNVWWWLNRSNGSVPPEYAPAIVDACRTKDPQTFVTVAQLCPKFPWPAMGVPHGEAVA